MVQMILSFISLSPKRSVKQKNLKKKDGLRGLDFCIIYLKRVKMQLSIFDPTLNLIVVVGYPSGTD